MLDIKTNITETIVEEVVVVTDVICNGCGESCKKNGGFYGLLNANIRGGYGSEDMVDGMQYIFSLCEACVLKVFDGFKIPVFKQDGVHVPKFIYKFFLPIAVKDKDAKSR